MFLTQKPHHYNGDYMYANGFAVLPEGLHMVVASATNGSFLFSPSLSIYLFIYLYIYSFLYFRGLDGYLGFETQTA